MAFLNTVKPLKKWRGLISFLSLNGGLLERGGAYVRGGGLNRGFIILRFGHIKVYNLVAK